MLLDFYISDYIPYTYKGEWKKEAEYQVNDLVSVNNDIYFAIIPSSNRYPPEDPEAWDFPSYDHRGEWQSSMSYTRSATDDDDPITVIGSNNRLYIAFETIGANMDPTVRSRTNKWKLVTPTISPELNAFANEIRTLVWHNLTPKKLPDSTILSSVYLRSAEIDMPEMLKLTKDQFESQFRSDADKRERWTIAIQKLIAARLAFVFPQIVETQIEGDRIEYAEIDWKERHDELIKDIDIIITPDLPGAGGGRAIFAIADRFVGY